MVLDLRDPQSYTDRRLTCDLIMKGGITSGVVYPLAVAELATTYRFRNIGGTSAGAIAAAAAAAAQHRGGADGFVALADMPGQLGTELQSLFRPQRRCRRMFRLLLVATVRPRSAGERVAKAAKLLALLLSFLLSPVGLAALLVLGAPTIAVGLAIGDELADHWIGGAAILILTGVAAGAATGAVRRGRRRGARAVGAVVVAVAVAGIAAFVVRDGVGGVALAGWLASCVACLLAAAVVALLANAVKVLPQNDFGLVGGSDFETDPAYVKPLTNWLDALLQRLAGRTTSDPPLTFGDLQRGPGEKADDGCNLTLLTTCISRGRTYYLPYDLESGDPSNRFYFDPDELRRSMPERVIRYLCELPRSGDWLDQALAPLVPLPAAEQLPIVMATRMSLSFPLLISAVPLRAVDWTLASNQRARTAWRDYVDDVGSDATAARPEPPVAERCWFSDGGIISNFPVHLFDRLLPRHPTFGINLRGFHPDRLAYDDPAAPECEKIFRPIDNSQGMSEWWTRWDGGGVAGLTGFAQAIKDTIQNWSDNDQMRVPGYRDRVVHVSHGHSEGGINLAMPPDVIERLGDRGRASALELKWAFAGGDRPTCRQHARPGDGEDPGPNAATDESPELKTDWRNHRWVRYRSSLSLLSDALRSVAAVYDAPDASGVESYADLARVEKPPSYRVTGVQRAALIEMVEGSPGGDDTVGGALEIARRIEERAERHVTADPRDGAPGPAPSLRITPGHRVEPPPT